MTARPQFGLVDHGPEVRWLQRELYLLGHRARAERDYAAQVTCRCARPVFDAGRRHCILCGHAWTAQRVDPDPPAVDLFVKRCTLGDPASVWPDDRQPVVTVCLLKLRHGLRLRLVAREAKRLEAARWHGKRLRRALAAREAQALGAAA